MDRSKGTSGDSLRAMIRRLASTSTVVAVLPIPPLPWSDSSSDPQPSSTFSRDHDS